MRHNHLRSSFFLFVLVSALSLAGCGKTIESAGPEAAQAMDAKDYATVESLAKSVKSLGNYRTTPDSTSILERAAASGNAHLVELLIQQGADAKLKQLNGQNAVAMAVFLNGNPEIIKVLAKAGADLNAAKTDGSTPLMVAAQHGAVDLVAALLENGADPKLQDKLLGNGKGRTALDMAKKARQILASIAPAASNPVNPTNQELTNMATKTMAGSATVKDMDRVIELLEAAMKPSK